MQRAASPWKKPDYQRRRCQGGSTSHVTGDFLEWTEMVWASWKTPATSEDVLRLIHTTSRDACYRLWHMLLICLSPVICCTTQIFPAARRFVCKCDLCVSVCVLLRHQSGVSIGPSVRRFPASFEAVWLCVSAMCLPTHMRSTERSHTPHTESRASNGRLIAFGPTWPTWFLLWHGAVIWFFHIVVVSHCLLMYLYWENVCFASLCPSIFVLHLSYSEILK